MQKYNWTSNPTNSHRKTKQQAITNRKASTGEPAAQESQAINSCQPIFPCKNLETKQAALCSKASTWCKPICRVKPKYVASHFVLSSPH